MQLKIISLNLWYGGLLFDQVVNFLQKEKPDILCAQEVYDNPYLGGRFNTVNEFKRLLDFEDVFFAPTFTHTTKKEGKLILGSAIFSKYPIIKTENKFYIGKFSEAVIENPKLSPFIPRSLQHAEIKLPKKILNVFNNHGIWGEDGLDNPARLKMAEFIIKAVRTKENVILCGDFNVNEGTQTIGKIAKILNNVFEKDKRKTSFNMKRKPVDSGYKNAVVDFIFVSDTLKVLESEMPNLDISDHLPLIVKLEI